MNETEELQTILSDIQSDDHVQEMKKYIQHGSVTTYEHCERVAKLSHKIDRLLSLHSNQKTLLTGAMLHDFYLYDWHKEDNGEHRLHGFHHAEKACANAKRYFDIDEETMHVIRSHMWPLNLKRIPLSKEAWIVCIADKCVSLHETLFRRDHREENDSERLSGGTVKKGQ